MTESQFNKGQMAGIQQKVGQCCPGSASGKGHDASCTGSMESAAAKKAAVCCSGAASGQHDASCKGVSSSMESGGVCAGAGGGTSVGAGRKHGALMIKNDKSVFNFIINDHAKVNQLYSKFNATTNKEERNQIAANLIKEITTHSFLEESILYPMFDKKLNTEGVNMHQHSVQEHQKVKNLLYSLDQNFDVGSEKFISTLNEAMANFNDHIKEEEEQILPKLQARINLDEEIELGNSWENRLAMGMHPTRPHPSAPTTEPLATAAAIASKPLDVARDAARFGSNVGSEAGKKINETMGIGGSTAPKK